MQENYHKWNSLYLSRDFEILVFGHDGFPVILIPPGNCRFYDAKDHGIINAAAHLIEAGQIKVYCSDTVDSMSFLNRSIHPGDRMKTHNGFENLLLNDVIAFAKYETGAGKVALAGMGLGAYHCVNTAFRHPWLVSHIFAMGGLFDIKQFLDGYYDDNIYFNNPADYLPGLQDPWYLNRIRNMDIVLGTGEWDFNLQQNYDFSGILSQKAISHQLDVRKETGHDWHWWKEMFGDYLSAHF